MAVIKCKMCGGDLVLTEGSPIAECEYCGSLQTVPNAKNEKMLTVFARANRLRANCEFDKAFGVYEAVVAEFPEEAEAYWGLVLCKYGIEYVDDPVTRKKIPTCHRSSFNSIMDDTDFEQVLENSDAIARKVYREEAKQIEELRKGILEVSKNEDPYDIFICYKETGANDERTLDSVLAQDIYDALTEKGYRVFFSRITLEDKLGQKYEPYIFAALNSAKVMLVIGTDYEYFNAVWVRNEWSRYMKIMETDKSKHLIPCFKGIDAYDMPKEFAKLQAQDLGKVGAIQDLLRGVDKLISPAEAVATRMQGADVAELLVMGNEALEKGEWKVASGRFDLALVADPKCADAHLGKLMAERKCKKRENLAKSKKRLEANARFKEVMAYADDTLKKELSVYCCKVKRRRIRRKVAGFLFAIIVLMAVAYVGPHVLETNYNKVVTDFLSGNITARDAYSKLSDLTWYKKDNALLFLAAAGMGDYDSAKRYNCEQLILSPTTYAFLEGNETKLPLETVKTVTYANDVKIIENMSLNMFTGLLEVILSDGVTNIGDEAFAECTNFTSITIPGSVTSIGKSAFKGCTGLTSVVLSEGVRSIGDEAFAECTAITSITIPGSVTSIGKSAFKGCTGLTSVVLSDGVRSIGDEAFAECTAITSITIPGSVTSIGKSAFRDCTGLTSVILSDGVTNIGCEAFTGCTDLTSITIPRSVTSIDNHAFKGCTGLTSITLSDGLNSIGEYAFFQCTGLTSIIIPDSVTSIGNNAFKGCTGLTSITIPDRATNIGHLTFEGCSGLTSIVIPDGVTSIADYAFKGCSGLTSVTIPDGVISIGRNAFYGCTGLTSIVIPDGVTSIGSEAFSGCTGLASITISNSLTDIGRCAFDRCTGLISITLPDGLNSIGSEAFKDCTGLTSITLPDGLNSIGSRAFWGCISLTSVTIPNSVTNVGDRVFLRCDQLKYIACEAPVSVKYWDDNWAYGHEDKVIWGSSTIE